MAGKIEREPMFAYYNIYSGAIVLETIDEHKWASSEKLNAYLKENSGMGMTKKDFEIYQIYLTIERNPIKSQLT